MDSHNFLHKQLLINVQFTSRENNSRAMDHTVEWQPSLGSQKNKNGFQSFLFLFVGTENTTKSRISITIEYDCYSLTI